MLESWQHAQAWYQKHRRLIRILGMLLLASLALGLLGRWTAAYFGNRLINVFAFLGIFFLSVPAVRLNEQSRQIDRARTMSGSIDESVDDAEQQRLMLNEIKERLAEGKGGWSRFVEWALYSGYALLFGSSLARIL